MGVSVMNEERLPKSEIEAVLSVPPLKVTEPRRVRHVSVIDDGDDDGIIKGCYQVILLYEKVKEEEERGWFVAGWIKESLGRALFEEPLLAGRLFRTNNNLAFDIVSNDSGIRLYEAKFPMTLSEFLGLTHAQKEHLEAELVFWNEIDHQTPQYSPLFYVQVTKFECGGYSIGISCSLLLADVLVVGNFLKKWAEIHNNLLPKNEDNITPIFYHPLLINEPPSSAVMSRTPTKNGAANTMLFKITSKEEEANFNMEHWRVLAMLCVKEAEKMLHKNVMGSEFYVIVKESYDVINIIVEGCSKSSSGCGFDEKVLGLENQIIGANWNDFGGYDYDAAFHEGNKPVLVSHWIGSVGDGRVIALPYLKDKNVSAVTILSLPTEN